MGKVDALQGPFFAFHQVTGSKLIPRGELTVRKTPFAFGAGLEPRESLV